MLAMQAFPTGLSREQTSLEIVNKLKSLNTALHLLNATMDEAGKEATSRQLFASIDALLGVTLDGQEKAAAGLDSQRIHLDRLTELLGFTISSEEAAHEAVAQLKRVALLLADNATETTLQAALDQLVLIENNSSDTATETTLAAIRRSIGVIESAFLNVIGSRGPTEEAKTLKRILEQQYNLAANFDELTLQLIGLQTLIEQNTSDAATVTEQRKQTAFARLEQAQKPRHDQVVLTYNGNGSLASAVKRLNGIDVQTTTLSYNPDGSLANVSVV
jgi:hypothetical protein